MKKENKKKIVKVNRMWVVDLQDKIFQLLKRGDNSKYLRHLIIQLYNHSSELCVDWLKMVCHTYNVSKQQERRYFSILTKYRVGA